MPSAAITGAYGSHGSIIRSRLEAAGWTTVALVRRPKPNDCAVAWKLGESPPDDLLKETDALVHCAYDPEPRKRGDVWRVNVDGSSVLLHAAERLGVRRVLYVSSMSAYAGTTQLYGQARLAVEAIALEIGGIAVRPGLLYGREAVGMAGALTQLTRLPVVPVLGGSARQFPVHEDDFAEAVVGVLNARSWASEVFGVAQPQAMSFGELLAALAGREGRSCRFLAVPWHAVYLALRLAEMTGVPLPLRSDSVLGLVRPAPLVPPSTAFPSMVDAVRSLEPLHRKAAGIHV